MHLQKNIFRITGKCALPAGVFAPATIVIDTGTGLINEVKSPTKQCDLNLPSDCVVFPGFVDTHVHGREDTTGTENYKEDFVTLGLAALNGGVVHVAEMGNNPLPPTDDSTYAAKEDLTKKSAVPVTLYAMMGPGTRPLRRKVPYKLCHARTTGANDIIFFPSRASIEATAERYAGEVVCHHPEDSEILKARAEELLHERKRPPEAEVSAIDFALYLTRKHKFKKSRLCHCSVCTGIQNATAAKKRGMPVTCEVAPHHLFFDLSMVTNENRWRMQMNPPLRTPEDRQFCINALRWGDIDALATDHAPHTDEDRKVRRTSGHPHLDTLGAFVTWLMVTHKFSPPDIARICCARPAEFLNEFLPLSFGRGYGKIAAGFMGSLTVLNLNRPVTVAKENLRTKCGWSPFEGITFPGSVEYTVVRGQVHESVMH
ncbi:MAG TPA: amidohydrolase family protein [Candidatus Paceibacterota bacterium]